MYHGNLKVCQQKNVPNSTTTDNSLYNSLLIIVFTTYTPNGIIFFVYELDTWSPELNSDFTLKDCLFGGVKLAKCADPDNYQNSYQKIINTSSIFNYFSRSNRKFHLSLHNNGSNSFLFVTATKIYQLKINDS